MRVLTCDNTKREYRGLPIDTHRIPTWLRDRNSESERKWDFCSAFKIKKKKKINKFNLLSKHLLTVSQNLSKISSFAWYIQRCREIYLCSQDPDAVTCMCAGHFLWKSKE